MAPPQDDAVLYVFDYIIKKYGIEFLHEMKKQNSTFVRGTILLTWEAWSRFQIIRTRTRLISNG